MHAFVRQCVCACACAPVVVQVQVAVKAVGVNPVDTYIRTGTHTVKPALPYTPGGDCAGVVTAVGPGVTKLKVHRLLCVHHSMLCAPCTLRNHTSAPQCAGFSVCHNPFGFP